MIKRFATITAVAAVLTAASGASADQTFKAKMSEEQEVPTPAGQGTSGKFEIQFNRDFTEGEYKLVINSGTRITQAHLHCAPAGVAGPVIIFLAGFQANGWDVDGQWITNATVTNANIVNTSCGSTLKAIADSAARGNVYVNAHSVVNPAGVARGQLEGN